VFQASGGEKTGVRKLGCLVQGCRLRRGLAAGLEPKGSDSPSASPRRRLRGAADQNALPEKNIWYGIKSAV